ncbi:MAG: hypothetical protein HY304_07675 [candidate division Zixibacteria bacterium]|nr:hypothetical protein [candidate division Zixibacteria bacterium]
MIVEVYTPANDAEATDSAPSEHQGKFVHIVGPQEEFLVLSPIELTEYHAHIVQRFSRRRADLSSVSTPAGDVVLFGTPGWSIKGGGRYRLDRGHRTLSLWGSSKAYGQFDGEHLRDTLKITSGWEDFAVDLDGPSEHR